MTTLLLVLAALTQGRDSTPGFTYAIPPGWTKQVAANATTTLSPPGADAQNFAIVILAGQPTPLNATAAHNQSFANMTKGARVGPVQRSTRSGWQVSEAQVVTAQGQNLWSGLFTRIAGGRLEGLMYVAASEAAFTAYRPSMDQVIASIAWPGQSVAAAPRPVARGTAIHGLIIPYPSSWTRRDDPKGAVTLVPPQIEGVRQYSLSVLPPTPMSGTHWETHRAMVKEILRQVPWAAEPVTSQYTLAPGPFIRTEIAGQVPAGGISQFQLYTAAHDGTMEAVVGVNGIDRNVVDPVLEAVTFKVAPRTDRPRIAEAYRRLDQRNYINTQGGAPIAGSLQYERILLRADGVADFSTSYVGGYAGSSIPPKVDVGLMSGDYGQWRAAGSDVQITRVAGGTPQTYRRENGGLKNGSAFFEPMPRVDGLRLSGRFAIRSGPNDPTSYYNWVEFKSDGRFSTQGLVRHAASGEGGVRPPEQGSGTYEIRDWTIFFRFASGEAWSGDFSILGRDINDPASIILRTSSYPRER